MSAKKLEQLVQPNGERFNYETLAIADNDTLEEIFKRGTMPDLRSISGWEFKGWNTFDLTQILGFRKFKKGFYRERPMGDDYSNINGYNVKIGQSKIGLLEPWVDIVKGGESIKFGWYRVYPVNLNERDNKYPNAVLINYDWDKNPTLEPAKQLRDYLIQVYPDNADLFVGKAYIALGALRLPISFFILQRENKSVLPA